MTQPTLTTSNIIDYLEDVLLRRGEDSYLGESVTMSEHMLQAACQAEKAGESPEVMVAALLHDIGHYSAEFPEAYLTVGYDNRHEEAGAAILDPFFAEEIVAPVRWHVQAKRYLCATEPDYLDSLSPASKTTLQLQGGIFNDQEIRGFEANPFFQSIVRVRRYDDAAKVPGAKTPPVHHYLAMARKLLKI